QLVYARQSRRQAGEQHLGLTISDVDFDLIHRVAGNVGGAEPGSVEHHDILRRNRVDGLEFGVEHEGSAGSGAVPGEDRRGVAGEPDVVRDAAARRGNNYGHDVVGGDRRLKRNESVDLICRHEEVTITGTTLLAGIVA